MLIRLIVSGLFVLYLPSCGPSNNQNQELKKRETIIAKICEYGEYKDTVLLFNNTNGNPIVAIGYDLSDIVTGRKFVASEFFENLESGEISGRYNYDDRLTRYYRSANKMRQVYSYAIQNSRQTNIPRPNLSVNIK